MKHKQKGEDRAAGDHQPGGKFPKLPRHKGTPLRRNRLARPARCSGNTVWQ